MADEMVRKTQQWLNQTYGGRTGYGNNITEDGITGINTVNALLRALQIELGITSTANSFGPTTISKFNTRFPNGIQQQNSSDETEDNIYGIIQGACWCKGYSVNSTEITKHFYSGTGNAIINLKNDAGCNDNSSTVTLNVMKALTSMTYFVCGAGGSEDIRYMQKYLNRTYENYIGLAPCDGIYSRQMNKALIYALQAEEGLSTTSANGNFGQTTKRCCPTIPYNNVETNVNGLKYSSESINKFIILLKISLFVNGYGSGDLSPVYNSSLISEFQSSLMLNSTGICNLSTWLSLLTSCGDTSRTAIACDTINEMTTSRLNAVISNGFSIIGRYLTNTPNGTLDKKIKKDELPRILNRGCKFFPIFQESGNSSSDFTIVKGVQNLKTAFDAALILKIPRNSVIYFAVDFDATDAQISNYILPYFQALHAASNSYCIPNYYKIGVYGTRNVCQQVLDAGYAVTSFVSDMSSGYSGNMGFQMPSNWTFDQFYETTVSDDSTSVNIDKVAFNENSSFGAVTQLETHKYIPDDIEDYYLGQAKNITTQSSTGEYFTVYSDHMQIKVKLTSETDTNPNLIVNISVFKYGESMPVYSVNGIHRDEIISLDWLDVDNGCDYRISYDCSHNFDISEPLEVHGDVDVYISTNYNEE